MLGHPPMTLVFKVIIYILVDLPPEHEFQKDLINTIYPLTD